MSTLPGMPHLGTYRIVLADPPWSHNNYGQAKHGAAKAIYDEMPLEALEEMPVGELAHPDGALLFLWCTGPQAADGAHLRLTPKCAAHPDQAARREREALGMFAPAEDA